MALITIAISMSRITTCLHCSTRLDVPDGITDKTLICPHCLADVDNTGPGFPIQAADINTDVKRDVNMGCTVLAVLIGLCILGIAIAFFQGELGITLLGFSCAALPVVAGIAIIRGRVSWGGASAQLPIAGRIIGIVLVVLGTFVAAIIFGLFACAVLWKPHWGL